MLGLSDIYNQDKHLQRCHFYINTNSSRTIHTLMYIMFLAIEQKKLDSK